RAFGRRVANELRWGRIATVGVTLAAALLALFYDDLIALLGTFAFGTFGAALAPALAVGLNWKRVTAAAATVSLAASFTVLLAVTAWTGRKEPDLPGDVLAVMEA